VEHVSVPLELNHGALGVYSPWYMRLMTNGVIGYESTFRLRLCGRRFRSYEKSEKLDDIPYLDQLAHPALEFPVYGGIDDRGRVALLADDQEFHIPTTIKNVEFLLMTEAGDDESPALLMQLYLRAVRNKLPLWFQGSLGGKQGRLLTFGFIAE